jgi:hypothetical protein
VVVVGRFLSQGLGAAALCFEGRTSYRDVRCVVIGRAVQYFVTVTVPSGLRLCVIWGHILPCITNLDVEHLEK